MFPNAVILQIRSLLEDGELSHRAIAEKVGVSRGVVDNVAGGRRTPRRRQTVDERLSPIHARGAPARCRHCGGFVYKPCLLCRTRAYQRQLQQRRLAVSRLPTTEVPRRVA